MYKRMPLQAAAAALNQHDCARLLILRGRLLASQHPGLFGPEADALPLILTGVIHPDDTLHQVPHPVQF